MKKTLIILLGVVIVAAAAIFGAMAYYTAPEGTFNSWHKSFDAAKADAAKRNVYMLVKIGSEM